MVSNSGNTGIVAGKSFARKAGSSCEIKKPISCTHQGDIISASPKILSLLKGCEQMCEKTGSPRIGI